MHNIYDYYSVLLIFQSFRFIHHRMHALGWTSLCILLLTALGDEASTQLNPVDPAVSLLGGDSVSHRNISTTTVENMSTDEVRV